MIDSIDQSPFPIFKWNLSPKEKRANRNKPYQYKRIIYGKDKADRFFKCCDKAYGKPFKYIEYKGIGNNLYEFTLTLNLSYKEVDKRRGGR